MRTFDKAINPIQVYFLTEASIVRDEQSFLDIRDAGNAFNRIADKATQRMDKGKVVMKRLYDRDALQIQRIEPVKSIKVDIADFNKRFGNL
jgi:hypothetical protein